MFVALNMHNESRSVRHGMKENENYATVLTCSIIAVLRMPCRTRTDLFPSHIPFVVSHRIYPSPTSQTLPSFGSIQERLTKGVTKAFITVISFALQWL